VKTPALSFFIDGIASLFQPSAASAAQAHPIRGGVPQKSCLLRENLALRSRLSKLTLTSLNRAGVKTPALSFIAAISAEMAFAPLVRAIRGRNQVPPRAPFGHLAGLFYWGRKPSFCILEEI